MPALNPWISQLRPNSRASLRLFCFPYAGGGAAPYHPWADVLPRNVEVCPIQLPGREMRIKQAAFSDVFALIDALVPNICPLLDKPFALFGHSMGALVAFELARRLTRDHHPLPERLFVSARVAPSVLLKSPPINNLPDDELIREIVQLNGTDKDVVGQTELMKLVLPTLRADRSVLLKSPPINNLPDDELIREIVQLNGTDKDVVGQTELMKLVLPTLRAD